MAGVGCGAAGLYLREWHEPLVWHVVRLSSDGCSKGWLDARCGASRFEPGQRLPA